MTRLHMRIAAPGIRSKIIIVIISAVCLSIGITTVINYIYLSNSLTRSTGEKISVISERTSQLVVDEIDYEIKILKTISFSPYIISGVKSANQEYESLSVEKQLEIYHDRENDWTDTSSKETNRLITEILNSPMSHFLQEIQSIDEKEIEIFVTDRHGYNIAMTNKTSDYFQADEKWWQFASTGKMYVSPPILDQSTQKWAIDLAVPIYDSASPNTLIGIARGTVDITRLLDSVFNIRFGESGKAVFISSDGKVYTREGNALHIEPASNDFLLSLESNKDRWIKEFSGLNGMIYVAAINEISNENQSIGWLLVQVERDEVKRMVLSSMQENLVIAALLIILLGFTGSLLSQNILEGIRVLTDEVRQIAAGDYTHTFSGTLSSSSDPEIKSLLDSFSRMKEAIQEREKTIQKSEQNYRHLVETMNEGLVMVNENSLIMYGNPRLAEMTGYSQSELRGMDIFKFFAPTEKENIAFQWTARLMGLQNSYESELMSKNGSVIPVLVSPQRLVGENDEFTGSLAVITDISTNKQVERTQRKKINELASLRKVDTAILTSTSFKSVAQTILDQIHMELGADAASIHFFHPHSTKSRLSRALLLGKTSQCAKDNINHDRIRMHSQKKESALFTSGIEDQIIWKELQSKGIKTLFISPILAGDELKGIVEIAYCTLRDIDDEWMSYFNALLTQTAVGIEKTELFEKLQTRNRELQEAYTSAITGWAKALELRDEETKGHCDRVVAMSLQIAKTFGFQGEDLENFQSGAFLHDIGKMGVPDSILLKPGPLTSDEWKIMRKHPVFAYQLLTGIPFLKNAYEIPYYHHERWDGSGYPHGLTGEDIPLSARIFAVVDVWDALTSDRPYRKAWPKDKARQYLEENRGILFDPQVVDRFLSENFQDKEE